MKNSITIILSLIFTYSFSQNNSGFNCSGVKLIIPSGAYLHVKDTAGNINIDAANGSDAEIELSGKLIVGGDWFNNLTSETLLNNTSGTVVFGGGQRHHITGQFETDWQKIEIEQGDTLVLVPGELINIDGDLVIDGNLLLQGDTSGVATLINYGSVSGSGNATVQLHLTEEKWHYVSPPMSDVTLGVFDLPLGHSDVYVIVPDESNNTWSYMSNVNAPLEPGKGYAVWVDDNVSQDETISFTGELNYANESFSDLIHTNNDGQHGWHLIGNPYPSHIKWNDNGGNWNLTNIVSTAKVWKQTDGNYLDKVAEDVVHSMQGFFIQVTPNYSGNNSITIPKAARTHDSVNFHKTSWPYEKLILTVSGNQNNFKGKCNIQFHPNATAGFDPEFDSHYLPGLWEAPQIYSSYSVNGKLSTNTLEKVLDGMMVPLHFETGLNGTYLMETEGLLSIHPDSDVYLEDKVFHTWHNLRNNPSVSFQYDTLFQADRFVLHFNPDFTDIDESDEEGISIFFRENTLLVTAGRSEIKEIGLYNMLGQELFKAKPQQSGMMKLHPDVPVGYYLVQVFTESEIYSQKIFIQ